MAGGIIGLAAFTLLKALRNQYGFDLAFPVVAIAVVLGATGVTWAVSKSRFLTAGERLQIESVMHDEETKSGLGD